jgi:hypothetical protein
MNHEIYVYVALGGKAVEDDELQRVCKEVATTYFNVVAYTSIDFLTTPASACLAMLMVRVHSTVPWRRQLVTGLSLL